MFTRQRKKILALTFYVCVILEFRAFILPSLLSWIKFPVIPAFSCGHDTSCLKGARTHIHTCARTHTRIFLFWFWLMTYLQCTERSAPLKGRSPPPRAPWLDERTDGQSQICLQVGVDLSSKVILSLSTPKLTCLSIGVCIQWTASTNRRQLRTFHSALILHLKSSSCTHTHALTPKQSVHLALQRAV